MAKVSINLVTYNGEKYIPYCLESLNNQTFKDFSLLIIDNGSLDKTVDLVEEYLNNPKNKKFAKKTTVIKNTINKGFAQGHNQAIQWTKSEYIFMVNQDIILDSLFLKNIIDFLQQKNDVAAASGRIYKWDFKNIASNKQNIIGKTVQIDSLGLKISKSHKVVEVQTEFDDANNKPQEVFGISGALPVYRRSALEATKIPLFHKTFKLYINQIKPKLYEYFDNDFFAYKEDVDLAYRLHLFGYRSFVVPTSLAWHDRSAAAANWLAKNRKTKSAFVNYHSYKNHLYFLIKNISSKTLFKHFLKISLYEIAKFTYLLLREQKTLPAIKEVISNYPKMAKKRTYILRKTGKDAWQNIEFWLK